MDYLFTLPLDLFRQTALNLPTEDLFKLSCEEEFLNKLDENFWQERIKIDGLWDFCIVASNTDGFPIPIEEKEYHYWLFIYFTSLTRIIGDLENDLANPNRVGNILLTEITLGEIAIDNLVLIKDKIERILQLNQLKLKIGNRLREERKKDQRKWPGIFFANESAENKKIGDLSISKYGEIILFGKEDTTDFDEMLKSDEFKQVLKDLEYDDTDDLLSYAFNQIYLQDINY